MVNEENKAQGGEIPAGQNTEAGVQPEANTLIERADAAAKRIEEANKVMSDQIKRYEELTARQLLGGGTQAGQSSSKPAELSDAEYAERALKGQINK